MKKVSNSSILRLIINTLIIIALSKVISVILFFTLPATSVEFYPKDNFIQDFRRFDFKNMLKTKKVKAVVEEKIFKKPEVDITNMILKGLYGTKKKGYIIVAMKSDPKKTSIIGIGESYQGYKLESILHNRVVFVKNSRNYILSFKDSKADKYSKKPSIQANTILKNTSNFGFNRVQRADILTYAKNPSKIWQEISIDEIKENGKIKGFKVKKVKKGSKFDKLGLKKGDVIIRANNIKLTSYRDAFKIYNNIKRLDRVEIVVLRNNQEVELIYEID